MTDMMGAIKAEALTAEIMSATSLLPRLVVFHSTTATSPSTGSTRPLLTLTDGMGIEGVDIDAEDG